MLFATLALAASLAAPIQPPATLAQRSDPGDLLAQRARLRVEGVNLLNALILLSEKSGVDLVFSPSRLPARVVTCLCDEQTVAEALATMLRGTGRLVTAVGRHVLIEEREVAAEAPTPLVFNTGMQTGPLIQGAGWRPAFPMAQGRTVSGTIVDDRDRPIGAARVSVVGSPATSLTGSDGKFRLEVEGTTASLRITAIGYRPRTESVRVTDQAITINLTPVPFSLAEVIVTGQAGAVERRAIGNSVTKIDAVAVAEVAPVRTVTQLLNGRASGLVMTSNGGAVGGGAKISIRGRNSLSLPTQPLLYVDGIRVDNTVAGGPACCIAGADIQGANVISRINDIDPSDIESIEVIKGPAAATLYGTEASNGVIQIITKRGRTGDRARISVGVEQGSNAFMDPEGRIPTNYMRLPTGIISINLAQTETDRGTPIWRTGRFQRYQLSADGGGATTSYHVASTVTKEQGMDRGNDLTSVGARAALTFTPRPNFSVNANVGINTGRNNLALQEGQSNIFGAINALPVLKDTPFRGSLFGPHEILTQVFDVFQLARRVTGGVQFQHSVGKHFNQRLVLGADFVGENNQVLIQRMTPEQAAFYGPDDAAGRKTVRIRDASTTTFDYSGTFNFGQRERLTSNTTVGAQYFSRFTRSTVSSGVRFAAPGLLTVGGTTVRSGSEDYVENNTAGVFVQQQFGWRNRFFLTGAVRGDDNSAFGKNYNFVVYPKVSASWVINEEPFWKVGFVNSLKLRAAFGAAGQQPDAFAALRTYIPVAGPGDQPALSPGSIGNPELKPERGKELELGFEAGLANQTVTIDFTYYRQTRKDAILLSPVPPSGGFQGSQFINAGEVQNRGAELQVTARLIDRRNFGWEMSGSVATNSNKIVDLGGLPPIPVGLFPLAQRHTVGYPVAAFWGQRIASGTVGANGQVTNLLCDTDSGTPVACATAPSIFLGRSTPKYEGSVTSTLTLFDKVRVYAMVDFKQGHKRFDTNLWARCTVFSMCEENVSPEKFDAVRLGYVQNGSRLQLIDGFVNDASFAKLREVSVSYELPTSFARSLGVSRGSLSVAGRNLHTWTKWSGLDPEVEQPDSFGLLSSSEQAILPLPVQFRFSVNLAF